MKKVHIYLAASVLGAIITTSPAIAGPATNSLSTCVADNTSGKDRKDLARWVFVAMSIHPEIQPYSHVTDANRDELDKKVAALSTRLIAENCKLEAKAAMDQEGGQSIKSAFSALGELAMQEIMSNPSVNASFSSYMKYIDKAKFEATFSKQ